MFVVKRNGEREEVSFDKVLKRIKVLSNELHVNVFEVAQKMCSRIFDGVRTSELDELAAQMCSSMILDHPDYGTLASRIIISNHQKNTSPSFSETVQLLYSNVDIHGNANPLVSEDLWDVVQKNKEKLNSYIDYSRDFKFDYFGFKTLEKAYLMKVNGKVVERPQHMFMRVALGIHGSDLKDAIQMYDHMSQKYYVHATPTLFNSGTRVPQLSSCYLEAMEDDSIDGIYNTLKDCALISKYAGGIGVHIHNVRARNSTIRGTNGVCSGIVPMLRVFNNTARYVNQAGRRNGSIAIYLEPWHGDIEGFLEMRKTHGNAEERAIDLFYALWIPDLFMERVQNNGIWSLMCPDECRGLSDVYGDEFKQLYERYENEGRFIKQVSAQELWFQILQAQIETGTPYMLYKDSVNNKNNQKNIGIIKSSNLCVAPETFILTDKGYYAIADLEGQEVNVWNGNTFSTTIVRKTGVNQKLITVKLDNGVELRCTPYHKFYVNENGLESIVEAQNLCLGSELIDFNLPVIQSGNQELENAYLQGFNNLLNKENCVVPLTHTLGDRIKWLSGLCDSDNNNVKYNHVTNDLSITCVNRKFIYDTMLLIQTLGAKSCITKNHEDFYELILSQSALMHLVTLGFKSKRFTSTSFPSQESDYQYAARVVAIEDNDEYDDTFCFNEPMEHKGIFNGIITGQCSEIVEVSDDKETAVCNLASVCLPTYVNQEAQSVDYDKLHDMVKVIVKNLNKVIDVNFYPIEKAAISNKRHRPIGIGVQGLADVFALLSLPFESDGAKDINKKIFETMYHAALEASMELAKKYGPYETFAGSPASLGVLQFDMWNVTSDWGKWNWDELRTSIKTNGLRNSLLIAPMPTASTSQIMGFTESFEPITSNIYKRKTMAGEFILVNKYLLKDLQSLGLWTSDIKNQIIVHDGSVQSIEQIPDNIKERYKTVWECKMRNIIDMAADRGAFVDQSQSMNLYVENPDMKKLTAMHFYAWNKGLKTGMYYLRTKAKSAAQKFTVDPRIEKMIKDKLSVQDDSQACENCSA
jgi:ribonucleoside-diphosphate reductase alpha chain